MKKLILYAVLPFLGACSQNYELGDLLDKAFYYNFPDEYQFVEIEPEAAWERLLTSSRSYKIKLNVSQHAELLSVVRTSGGWKPQPVWQKPPGSEVSDWERIATFEHIGIRTIARVNRESSVASLYAFPY